MSLRCAGQARGWGVKCSGIGIACRVITWPCHVMKFACFASHRQDVSGVCACGAGWGGGGAIRRVGLEWSVCVHLLARAGKEEGGSMG